MDIGGAYVHSLVRTPEGWRSAAAARRDALAAQGLTAGRPVRSRCGSLGQPPRSGKDADDAGDGVAERAGEPVEQAGRGGLLRLRRLGRLRGAGCPVPAARSACRRLRCRCPGRAPVGRSVGVAGRGTRVSPRPLRRPGAGARSACGTAYSAGAERRATGWGRCCPARGSITVTAAVCCGAGAALKPLALSGSVRTVSPTVSAATPVTPEKATVRAQGSGRSPEAAVACSSAGRGARRRWLPPVRHDARHPLGATTARPGGPVGAPRAAGARVRAGSSAAASAARLFGCA